MKKHNELRLISVLSKYLSFYYIDKDLKEGTRVNYQSRFNFIIRFLSKKKQADILVTEVDEDFINDFRVYSLNKGDKTFNSRNLEMIRGALRFAKNRGLIASNVLDEYKAKRERVKKIISLSKEELQNWHNYKGNLQRHKYLYLLSCYTGLSYGDLNKFEVIKRERMVDAKLVSLEWITGNRCKTGREYWVPLLPEAKEIIECLLEQYGKIPSLNNSYYNKGLKIIAKKLNINKHLTTHTARKTYATLMYEAGWPEGAIALSMGIAATILNKHYILKSQNLIENEWLKRMAV